MRFGQLLEDWGHENGHDALAHEIISSHIRPLEQGGRRWYSQVHPGISHAGDGVHKDLEAAGWRAEVEEPVDSSFPPNTISSHWHHVTYQHDESPNEIRVKRYAKDDEPHGVRTIYHAHFSPIIRF